MDNSVTQARPYAKAVFAIAKAQKQMAAWSKNLALLVNISEHSDVQRVIGHPKVSAQVCADIFIAVAQEALGDMEKNFVRVLAANGRFALLADIAAVYETLRAQAEARVAVSVTSAVALSEAQRNTFAAALEKRFGCAVGLDCQVDATLLGGAVIRAGDSVIDGSVRGRLDRLAERLRA